MNQKELNELRRRWKPDKNAISRIYGCFVNSNKEIMTDLDESLGMMTQEEAEKYLSRAIRSGRRRKRFCTAPCWATSFLRVRRRIGT